MQMLSSPYGVDIGDYLRRLSNMPLTTDLGGGGVILDAER